MRRLFFTFNIILTFFLAIATTALAQDTPVNADARNFYVTVTKQGMKIVDGLKNGAELETLMNTHGSDDMCIITIDLRNSTEVLLCASPTQRCININGANVTLNLRHRCLSGFGTMFHVSKGSLSVIDNVPAGDNDPKQSDIEGEIANPIEIADLHTIKVDGSGTLIYRGGNMSRQHREFIYDIFATDNARIYITGGKFAQGFMVRSTNVKGRITGGGFHRYQAKWTNNDDANEDVNLQDDNSEEHDNAAYTGVKLGTFVPEGYKFYKIDAENAAEWEPYLVSRDNRSITTLDSEGQNVTYFWIKGSYSGEDILTLDAADATTFRGYEPREYKKVVFKRSFKTPNYWYSLNVPFKSKAQQWTNMKIYSNDNFNDFKGGEGVITVMPLADTEDVMPNTPYYIKMTDVSTKQWEFENQAVELSLPVGHLLSPYYFVCNYDVLSGYISDDQTAYYYINDGVYWKRTDKHKYNINPTRWYFYTKNATAMAKGIVFKEGTPTGMPEIRIAENDSHNEIYTIDGRRVKADISTLQKGLYIINGKKRIVK